MQFAEPEALYLWLLLPLLLVFYRWSATRKARAIERLGEAALIDRLSLRTSQRRERTKLVLFASGLFFLILALARPQWGRGEQEFFANGVDVFLILDTSFSMDATDVAPSRMERARYIASQLMDRLQGNRIGVIAFSGTAFVQCPLTLDYGAARIFLDTVATGIVPDPGTNIEQALEAARRGFVARNSRYKVVILLTDGEQQQGGDAAAIGDKAREDGIVIHTVGVGTPGGEPIPVRDDKGEVTDYVRGDDGQPVLSRLDERMLGTLSLTTGGEYVRVSERDTEIETLSTRILEMEGEELSSQLFTRYQERFYWPLGIAVLLLVADAFVGREKRAIVGEAS